MVRASYKFRLYPNRTQESKFDLWLWRCRELYNACIEHRQQAWKKAGKTIQRYTQQNALPEIKADRPEFNEVYAQVLQDVCGRVDKAFRAFFRRVRAGQKPGYPRFRGRDRYDSFTYPQFLRGFKATDKRVLLPMIGHVRWTPWKPLGELGTIKTATVKREGDEWYVVLSCENPVLPAVPAPTTEAVGIDLGLINLVTLSDGRVLGDLAPLKAAEKKLRRVQRILSRRKRGSGRRLQQKTKVVRQHQHLARQRRAQLHEMSTAIVREHATICVEDLNVLGLSRSGGSNAQGRGLRRNIHHASWGAFIEMLTYKAEWAGRRLVKVNPVGTSQECSGCGAEVRKDLSVRVHRCSCRLVLDRDHNAALNVLHRGLTVPACEPGTGLGDEANARGDGPSGLSSNREVRTGVVA